MYFLPFCIHSLSKNIFCLLHSFSKNKPYGCSSFQQMLLRGIGRKKTALLYVSPFVGCVLVDVRIFFRSRPNNIFFSLPPEFIFFSRAFAPAEIIFSRLFVRARRSAARGSYFFRRVGPRYPSRATADLGTPRLPRVRRTHGRTDIAILVYNGAIFNGS